MRTAQIISAQYIRKITEKTGWSAVTYLKFKLIIRETDGVNLPTYGEFEGRAYERMTRELGLKKGCQCKITGPLQLVSTVENYYFLLNGNGITLMEPAEAN